MSRSQFFFQCLNATIPLTSTLANEYPSSNETSKKNGTVRGDCIACDALFLFTYSFFSELTRCQPEPLPYGSNHNCYLELLFYD